MVELDSLAGKVGSSGPTRGGDGVRVPPDPNECVSSFE
jgi:hypothetical protein